MNTHNIFVTGGAGYLGSTLVPKLLAAGHRVTLLDCFLFGEAPMARVAGHENLTMVRGDIRDTNLVESLLDETTFHTVIHLAAISNDPCSDLDPSLTRSVNDEAVDHIMRYSKKSGVRRFLYASSASVYGIKETPDVTEDLSLEPMTLYAKYKAKGERILWELVDDSFIGVAVRAATVCGWSPRLRLDLTINILTSHAIKNGSIRVFGGSQLRPNIHIDDLTDFYVFLISAPSKKIQGQAFNISQENASVMDLAKRIRAQVNPKLAIEVVPTQDLRSYHLSAKKAADVLGFHPTHTLDEAIIGLQRAFEDGRIPKHTDSIYRNVVWMNEHPDYWKNLRQVHR